MKKKKEKSKGKENGKEKKKNSFVVSTFSTINPDVERLELLARVSSFESAG